MKRKLYTPIMLSNLNIGNREDYLRILKDVKADVLFIAIDRAFFFEEDKTFMTEELYSHLRFFESHGIEAGAWLQAFGFGDPLPENGKEATEGMTKIRSVIGVESGDAFCPEDPLYMDFYLKTVEAVAKAKPSLLMLDDDLCLSVRPGIGCFCKKHVRLLEEKLGRTLNMDSVAEELFTGESNDTRKAWLDLMGDTLRNFCRKVSVRVASVCPHIRVGFCAGFTSWDMEGVDAVELTRILAGKNKPFLRFTSAPYWVAPHWNRFRGQRLHGVIEFAREQELWCRDTDIEVFSEADSYPRPRYHIPGNLLEIFDGAMIASGETGILKYIFDYFAPPSYETGYSRLHKKNVPFFEYLEKHFTNKQSAGIKVYEKKRKFAHMTLPSVFSEGRVMDTALPVASSMLASLTVPVSYDTSRCGIAFGDNLDEADELLPKMILDIRAAVSLMNRGVDVGLADIREGDVPSHECFGENRISLTHQGGTYFNCTLKEGAEVLSSFVSEKEKQPAVYRYSDGEREFLVLTADAYSLNQSSSVFCSYLRQTQILSFYSEFPVIRNSPFVYQLCKKKENETVSFFANIFEDEMWDFDIELDGEYRKAECYGAEAELCGKVLHVSSSVPPYGMFAVRLSR